MIDIGKEAPQDVGGDNMGWLGSLIKFLLKYVAPVTIGFLVVINVTILLAYPVQLNPEMPVYLRFVAIGTPLVAIVGSLGLYLYSRELKPLKYGIPVAIVTPWIVLGISWLLIIPQIVSRMTPNEMIFYIGIPAAVILLLLADAFFGVVSGKPWLSRDVREVEEIEVTAPTRVHPSSASEHVLTGGFRILESPEERVQKEESSDQSKLWEPYESVLRAMMSAGVPLIYRLERTQGRTNEYYLTLSKGWSSLQSNMQALHSALSANLPNHRLEKITRLNRFDAIDQDNATVVTLTGEPLRVDDPNQRCDPLTVAARALVNRRNGIIQSVALPVSSGLTRSLKRIWLGREYKAKASQAQVSVTRESSGFFSKGKQETSVYTDMIESEKAERVRRELDRHSASNACDVEMSIACWGQDSATHSQVLMDILRGAIRPADSTEDFNVHVHKGRQEFEKILRGKPIGDFTLLLPIEATCLFTLPQTDIGTPIVKRSVFSSSTTPMPELPVEVPEMAPRSRSSEKRVYAQWNDINNNSKPFVALGNTLSPSGEPLAGTLVWFPTQKFESHFGIYGNVRSGKTWTALQIVAQTIKSGIKATILVPRRSRDWTRLIYLFPEISVFTAGDSNTAPLRINIFRPPENVPLSIWMKTLVRIFSGLLPNDRVMTLHFDDVTHTVYRNCGWDSKSNSQGRPILLNDLWDAVEEVSSDLQYGDELKSNFYGALFTRISSMLRNHTIVDMYNTEAGITWKEIAESNIIIDMEYLPDEDRAFLMSLLAAGLHTYKMFNPSKKVENLLVLEEASYILKKSEGQDFYGPNASETVLNLMIDLFTTCGGNGLGTLTIEQLPSRLADEIVKLIVNVITHAIGDESERRVIAGHIGLNDKKIDHLQQMKKGEVITYLEGECVPKNVLMWSLDYFLKSSLPDEPVTPDWVRRHMESVYERCPNLSNTIDLSPDIIDRIQRVKSPDRAATDRILPVHRSSPQESIVEVSEYEERIDKKLRGLVQRPRYVKHLAERVEKARSGDIEPLAQLVIELAEEFDIQDVDSKWVAERLVRHSANCYPTLLDPDLVDITLIVIQGGTA